MSFVTKIQHRDWRDRLGFAEALAWLCVAKIVVTLVPFRLLARMLGTRETETGTNITPADRKIAVRVSWAVQAAARHVPLGFVCLPQALAAWRMLRRRGLPTTLYFGVAIEPGGRAGVLAHAWLRAGDKIVTGAHREGQYVRVAMFASVPGVRPGR